MGERLGNGGGGSLSRGWGFRPNKELGVAGSMAVRGVLNMITGNLDKADPRPVIHLGQGDPSMYPSFRASPDAEDAVVNAVRSAAYNCYAPTVGLLTARRALAEYLSRDLPYQLSPDDVYVVVGGNQSIEIIMSVLCTPGANILLPKPGFPYYEAHATFNNLEYRHFDLIPEKGWEVDLAAVEALADGNTVAMVLINPGNPCGSVYTYQHLEKVAETARKLGILVIADEVYAHIAFGSNPFVPMGVFGSTVPVLTIGSLSKRYILPGWKLGWIATTDPNGILKKYGIVDAIKHYLNISVDPATIIQGAVPQILEKTDEKFTSNIVDILKKAANICYETLKEIPGIACPHKPEGSMFVMLKLNLSLFKDVTDDIDFCVKLAKEESVVILPGTAVGMKNWLRMTFAMELPYLEDGLTRIKSFCQRHAKMQ